MIQNRSAGSFAHPPKVGFSAEVILFRLHIGEGFKCFWRGDFAQGFCRNFAVLKLCDRSPLSFYAALFLRRLVPLILEDIPSLDLERMSFHARRAPL